MEGVALTAGAPGVVGDLLAAGAEEMGLVGDAQGKGEATGVVRADRGDADRVAGADDGLALAARCAEYVATVRLSVRETVAGQVSRSRADIGDDDRVRVSRGREGNDFVNDEDTALSAGGSGSGGRFRGRGVGRSLRRLRGERIRREGVEEVKTHWMKSGRKKKGEQGGRKLGVGFVLLRLRLQ